MSISVYIHIPFCSQICNYCDFNKFLIQNQPVSEYLQALEKEIQLVNMSKAKTIFIGGGTPTALTAHHLGQLMNLIQRQFQFDRNVEFTIEANPNDLTIEKLRILRSVGINRLSIGVQSFNNNLLNKIGRNHQAEDVFRGIDRVYQQGFANISIDLIYGLPNQTLSMVERDIELALSLDIQHISAYSLIVEPKTVFYHQFQQNRLHLPTEDTEADMYQMMMDQFMKNGYQQYEISNYAKTGYTCQHNLTYWNNEDYLGFGVGAHGKMNHKRFENVHILKKYFSALQQGIRPIQTEQQLTKQEQMEEEMFLGLRKTEGVSQKEFANKYQLPVTIVFASAIKKNIEKALLEIKDDRIQLTHQGRLLGNEVFQDFLLN